MPVSHCSLMIVIIILFCLKRWAMHLNWLCSLLAHQASSNNIYNRNCNRKNNNLVLQILVSFGGVDGDASADLHIQIYSQCRSHTLRGLVKSSLAYDVYALRSSYVLAPSILNTCRPSACGLLIFIIRACAFFSLHFVLFSCSPHLRRFSAWFLFVVDHVFKCSHSCESTM